MNEEQAYSWDLAEVGDASPPFEFEVTAEKIVAYCRAARYENLAYNNQPAAREMGLPGIIAPPAMLFVYAPTRLGELIASRGCVEPWSLAPGSPAASLRDVSITFAGRLVSPGEVITSVTALAEKLQQGEDRLIKFQVAARNQRNEPVARYSQTYSWPATT